MERSIVGKTPLPPRREEDSYLDHLASARNPAIQSWFRPLAQDIREVAVAANLPIALTASGELAMAPTLSSAPSRDPQTVRGANAAIHCSPSALTYYSFSFLTGAGSCVLA